jgi:hypothetical protein
LAVFNMTAKFCSLSGAPSRSAPSQVSVTTLAPVSIKASSGRPLTYEEQQHALAAPRQILAGLGSTPAELTIP